MRIVHVTDTYTPCLGGKELHVRDLAHVQAAAGHDVVVLTATPAGPEGPDDATGAHGRVRVVRVDRTDGGSFLAGWTPAAAAALAGADVVHAHLSVVSPFAWAAIRAARAAGLPVLAMVHVIVPGAGVVRHGWRAAARVAGPGVTWGTVSRAAAAALRDLVPGPVHVLPNGIDPALWEPGPAVADVRRPVTVVASGRLAPRKRVLPLVAVLDEVDRLVGGRVPWRAVVVGDGPLAPLVRQQVRGRGLQHRVSLVGRVDRARLREVYAASDVFVAPARESFGLAALEARCAGLPVVALVGAGPADFVTHGVEGLLAADDEGLARAVAHLVTDAAARQRVTAYNRAVPTAMGWTSVLDRCLALYTAAALTARPVRAATAPSSAVPTMPVRLPTMPVLRRP